MAHRGPPRASRLAQHLGPIMSVKRIQQDKGRGWTLYRDAAPPTANQFRRKTWPEQARVIREWREAFYVLARAAHVPRLERIHVDVYHVWRSRRSIPDVCACMPAWKAACDGLVDAGVIPDDGPASLISVTFFVEVQDSHAIKGSGLRIVISDISKGYLPDRLQCAGCCGKM